MNTEPNVYDKMSEVGQFYQDALQALIDGQVEFLLGGAFALNPYTGIVRDTKDIDAFVHPRDRDKALDALRKAGYETEVTFPHWLSKAWCGDHFVDVIYSSGNGIAEVDDEWFEHAIDGQVMNLPVKLCPPEEMIWSKSFIMERERFDGADIMHLLRASGQALDWERLLRRFDGHWRVLYAHLVMFGYVYPNERTTIPAWVLSDLNERLLHETRTRPSPVRVCRGPFISRSQYLPDIEEWGYLDARTLPTGTMSEDDVELWTEAAREQATESMTRYAPPAR
jgi:hypothetical protein